MKAEAEVGVAAVVEAGVAANGESTSDEGRSQGMSQGNLETRPRPSHQNLYLSQSDEGVMTVYQVVQQGARRMVRIILEDRTGKETTRTIDCTVVDPAS